MTSLSPLSSSHKEQLKHSFFTLTEDEAFAEEEVTRFIESPLGDSSIIKTGKRIVPEDSDIPITPLTNAIFALLEAPLEEDSLSCSDIIVAVAESELRSNPVLDSLVEKVNGFVLSCGCYEFTGVLRENLAYDTFARIQERQKATLPDVIEEVFLSDLQISIREGDSLRITQLIDRNYADIALTPAYLGEAVAQEITYPDSYEAAKAIYTCFGEEAGLDFISHLVCHIVAHHKPRQEIADAIVSLTHLIPERCIRDVSIALASETALSAYDDDLWIPLLFTTYFRSCAVPEIGDLPDSHMAEYMYYVAGAANCEHLYEYLQGILTEEELLKETYRLHERGHMPPFPLATSLQEKLVERAVCEHNTSAVESFKKQVDMRRDTVHPLHYNRELLRSLLARALSDRNGPLAAAIIKLIRATGLRTA